MRNYYYRLRNIDCFSDAKRNYERDRHRAGNYRTETPGVPWDIEPHGSPAKW